MKRRILLAATAAAALCMGSVASAQDYPVKTVRWIVTYPPGGTTDVIARIVAEEVGKDLGVSIIVDNKAGAGGTIGMDAAAKARPDGGVYLVSDASIATAPSLYRTLAFDPVRDLQPVALFATVPHIVVVNPALPVKTLGELVARAKGGSANALNFASGGLGSPLHLSGEVLKDATHLSWTHVPYKGASPAVLAVVSGEADVATPSAPGALPQIAAGKLRALAVTSDKRLARLPEVPTVAELGFPKAAMSGWVGLHAPANLPRPLLTQMEAAVSKALANPAVKARLEEQGANVGFAGATPYREFTLREMERWKGVVAVAGIKPE